MAKNRKPQTESKPKTTITRVQSERKKRRLARALALAARPLSEISNNAKTKRDTRKRAQMVKSGELSPRRWGSLAGQRQFGSEAKAHHLEQHEQSRKVIAEANRRAMQSRQAQGFVISDRA